MNHIRSVLYDNIDTIKKLLDQGLTQKEIRSRIGAADMTFRSFCRDNNIQQRTPIEAKKLRDQRDFKRLSIKDIIDCYINKELSATEIGKIYHCNSKTICKILRQNNIKIKKSRDRIQSIDIDIVKQKYFNESFSLKETAKYCDVSMSTMIIFFKLHNLIQREISYRHKKYILPSGKKICLQGYEPHFLDYIFSEKLLKENEICYKPQIVYYVDENGKNRRYYPDFYIPKLNLIVEIKSWWILEKQTKIRVECKSNTVINRGYNFCMIMDNNFNEFKDILKKHECI